MVVSACCGGPRIATPLPPPPLPLQGTPCAGSNLMACTATRIRSPSVSTTCEGVWRSRARRQHWGRALILSQQSPGARALTVGAAWTAWQVLQQRLRAAGLPPSHSANPATPIRVPHPPLHLGVKLDDGADGDRLLEADVAHGQRLGVHTRVQRRCRVRCFVRRPQDLGRAARVGVGEGQRPAPSRGGRIACHMLRRGLACGPPVTNSCTPGPALTCPPKMALVMLRSCSWVVGISSEQSRGWQGAEKQRQAWAVPP